MKYSNQTRPYPHPLIRTINTESTHAIWYEANFETSPRHFPLLRDSSYFLRTPQTLWGFSLPCQLYARYSPPSAHAYLYPPFLQKDPTVHTFSFGLGARIEEGLRSIPGSHCRLALVQRTPRRSPSGPFRPHNHPWNADIHPQSLFFGVFTLNICERRVMSLHKPERKRAETNQATRPVVSDVK